MYRLLIVDDEPLVRRGIRKLADLSQMDQVYEASNGEEALKIVQEHDVDIMLLDINMPKMDGLTLADRAKQVNKHIRICMITGYDYFDYAQKALRIGVDDYILKPVSRSDIDSVIKKMVKSLEAESVNKEVAAIGEASSAKDFESKLKETVEQELYKHEFSLSYLADRLGFSTGYLSSIFKEIYGISFQEYVTKGRMDRARLLLITTDMKHYEVADAIGMDDVNYFSTRFKKHMGMTPKQYRQKVKHSE